MIAGRSIHEIVDFDGPTFLGIVCKMNETSTDCSENLTPNFVCRCNFKLRRIALPASKNSFRRLPTQKTGRPMRDQRQPCR
jgi:hypothetical protein